MIFTVYNQSFSGCLTCRKKGTSFNKEEENHHKEKYSIIVPINDG